MNWGSGWMWDGNGIGHPFDDLCQEWDGVVHLCPALRDLLEAFNTISRAICQLHK